MKKIVTSLLYSCVLTVAQAAPLDAFLSADPNPNGEQVHIETAYDLVNSRVDVLHIRAKDATYAGTNVGDYHGAHVRLGVALTPRLWLDGAFWDRRISYQSDVEKIKTWQIAAQYKLQEGEGYRPSIALRVGAWGNYAGQARKSTPTAFGGETLNTITVVSPRDQQLQLNLIASSAIFDGAELSGFVGTGISQVTLSSISGTASKTGCQYNLVVGALETVGTLATACNANLVIQRFSIPNRVSGIDVNNEAKYRASYVQGGLMLKWRDEDDDWQVRAGYQYQLLSRKNVDDTVQRKGGIAYRSNHVLIGEISYAIVENGTIFIRGQYMSNQFVGEVPFAYNALTASRFDRRYGILSAGLTYAF